VHAFAARGGIVLATPRLVLRGATEADIPVLHGKVFGVSEVMKWVQAKRLRKRG
jgi:hypothetical protein